MNTATLKLLKVTKSTVKFEIRDSQYGTPQAVVTLTTGAHWRQESALLHLLAAEIELATPKGCSWPVIIEDNRIRCEVDNMKEAQAALEICQNALS